MENTDKIISEALNKIYLNYSQKDIDCSSLKAFEFDILKILQEYNVNINLFDLYFIRRHNNTSILFAITSENQHGLFSEILEIYKSEFESIPKEKLESMLWVDENDCHKILYSHLGKDFFNDLDHLNSHVFYYSNKNFVKYYLLGKFDNFFKIENLSKIDDYIEDIFTHLMLFYSEDKVGFEKALFNPPSNLSFESKHLIYIEPHPNTFSSSKILHLPNENEINTLISIWGVDKTSEVISDYMKLQKKYMETSFPYTNNIEYESNKLKHLIKTEIDLNNCGSSLAFGLRHNTDLLSHFIIKGIITHDHLLDNIKDKEIQAKTHHDVLKSSLETKSENKPNKKNKL